MNATEFRAVLDWWMDSAPHPLPRSDIIAAWLDRESLSRGYRSTNDAYTGHKAAGNEPSAQPPLSEDALTKLGQAMLKDYVAHSSMTTTQRLITALRELATATQDTLHTHYAETRCCLVTRQKCEAAKELLAELKST